MRGAGGVHGGGVKCVGGMYIAGGCAWQVVHGKGTCVAGDVYGAGGVHGGGVHGRRCAWWGCVAGGMRGRGVNEWAVRILLEYILVITILL